MSNILHISYGINKRNRIVFVNDAWDEFALANGSPELAAGNVLNCDLWDFISDETTRAVYLKLIEKIRDGHSASFNFRCDSPVLRRFFEMEISLRADEIIRFDTRLIKSEERIGQNVIQPDARRANDVLVICSWCKKINTSEETWHEIEEALPAPELFESESVPQISHGMCVSCYRSILENHRDIFK